MKHSWANLMNVMYTSRISHIFGCTTLYICSGTVGLTMKYPKYPSKTPICVCAIVSLAYVVYAYARAHTYTLTLFFRLMCMHNRSCRHNNVLLNKWARAQQVNHLCIGRRSDQSWNIVCSILLFRCCCCCWFSTLGNRRVKLHWSKKTEKETKK